MPPPPASLTRRGFLRTGGLAGVHAVTAGSLFTLGCDTTAFGPLREPDENGIRLPLGFRSRVLARTGETVPGTGYTWHGWPDGGAVFPLPSGWVYVSNSELFVGGGVGALRFDARGRVLDAYSICSGTRRNCAGGAMPWGTWLSCEEVAAGLVYECDPLGVADPVQRPALGTFNHEAVAADPVEQRLYLTEDRSDGGLYRFTPDAWGELGSGLLEIAQLQGDGSVLWHEVPDPNPVVGTDTETRHQVALSTPFQGGEGVVYDRGHVYFTTKGDDRVWDHDVAAQTIVPLYHRGTDPIGALSGVDNITATPSGELVVAEDGGNMELVMMNLAGEGLPLLRVEGQGDSELCGPAFDPTGRRLYFSSQRGTDGSGITYEVQGPFRVRWRRELWRQRVEALLGLG